MLGSPAGPGGPSQRGLWPLAPAPAPSATSFSTDAGLSKYGVYSLFPGGPTFGSALYSHASTIGRFASGHIQQSSGNAFHAAHKVSDSLFSATGYTFGAPTPPPGSPYSPIPVAQLELLTKGYSNNIIIQQSTPADFPLSPKKVQITEKKCDEKCCSVQRTLKGCLCPVSPVKKIQEITPTGCSRTNPIEWTGVNVKKEPGTPCQVAEITTSMSPVVKVEVTSPTQKNASDASNLGGSILNGAQIPVGIAVARQRVQHELVASPSLPPAGLLATVNTGGGAQIKEIDNASMAAGGTSGAGLGGGTILQCGDDRTSGLASWQMGGHSQTLTTPTLWQYPAPVPVEPMVPLPMSTMPPMGLQLVRDPTTGGFLLLPTAGIEPVQQTVVWPSYSQPSPVLLPSLSSIPPPPLQLLSSASSDYLSSSTTLHQHTQTHSTRLVAVTTDTTKRKIPMPLPATTLIKIETDGTLDQTKTLQAVSTIANNTGMFTDQVPPLVTTHVIYQHPTTNLIVSQTPVLSTETASCRSQATSPVITALTPPPESVQIHEEEQQHLNVPSTVQDASNQTDTPICSEDDITVHTMITDVDATEGKIGDCSEDAVDTIAAIQKEEVIEHPQQSEQKLEECLSSSFVMESEPEDGKKENRPPDLSGLELLSNSIVEFEMTSKQLPEERSACDEESTISTTSSDKERNEDSPAAASLSGVDDSLGGLDLLCALAEQRIREEKIDKPSRKDRREKSKERCTDRERRKEKRKSKRRSLDEPKRKKIKHKSSDKEHRKKDKRHHSEKSDSDKERVAKCACQYRHYKTPESEQEVKRFLESKNRQNFCCQDWPCMNAMELDMRMKLAELQRTYREKKEELSKLKPKKHSHHTECSKKSRKKSTNSERSLSPPVGDCHKIENDLIELEDKHEEHISSALKRRRSHSSESSSEKILSSSKKRKVGRPKRMMSDRGELVGTETIVARKLKSNFVGCLLAAKEKLKQQSPPTADRTPPRYIEETTYTHKLKKVKNNNTIILTDDVKSSNIRPKLKAEPTIKTVDDDDVIESRRHLTEDTEEVIDHIEEDIGEDEMQSQDAENTSTEIFSDGLLDKEETPTKENVNEELEQSLSELKESVLNPCALTEALLEVDKLRVLTAMGGLFYAGQLNAIEPPDVYSITLDGERGNRPHIMSREEILRDAIVEVAPKTTEALPVGTRLCAYWSQQYRCLYPGTAAEPGTPDPQLDGKFVCVEFDDGDSGRIALNDIRLLPPNYPIIEYDPNPLLSLSKRKRRASTSISTEEKHLPEIIKSVAPTLVPSSNWEQIATEQTTSEMEQYKEKRRMKKRKKEKQKDRSEERKKKRKHRCTDEPCPHKKHHKKHKKHRKHHDKSRTSDSSDGSPQPGGFICQIIEDEEPQSSAIPDENRVVSPLQVIEEDGGSTQSSSEHIPRGEEDSPANPDDEVTMDDILESPEHKKSKKFRDRQESCESRSKMSAFLPARQLWHWAGKGYKRTRAKGKSKKCFYKSIQRGKETIMVGDAAVFLSTGRPDRPYIGRIESMWELCGTMAVKVKWFYHPEETIGCPSTPQYPGALFESPHLDENDVQTISHKCEVLPLNEYTSRLGDDPARYATIYDNNDIYYLAGYYDPISKNIKVEAGIPFTE